MLISFLLFIILPFITLVVLPALVIWNICQKKYCLSNLAAVAVASLVVTMHYQGTSLISKMIVQDFSFFQLQVIENLATIILVGIEYALCIILVHLFKRFPFKKLFKINLKV
ncbi:hypothetical protein [Peribacillus asahii]|uniref:hypothetical protein n=1 Tax=Peribacillus asahii TaxID=228899 RepID=UPI00207AA3F6|nr:hypothetical protein [Peribacillus asahii]USK62328.1 hypothetical protein LIT37_22785 [Peribacillus asahii]